MQIPVEPENQRHLVGRDQFSSQIDILSREIGLSIDQHDRQHVCINIINSNRPEYVDSNEKCNNIVLGWKSMLKRAVWNYENPLM